MKFLLMAVLFIVALNAVSALPTNESGDLVRHRRVTCDLLSYGGKVNDSACAAHCLTLKKAGGSCRGGVCHCRK